MCRPRGPRSEASEEASAPETRSVELDPQQISMKENAGSCVLISMKPSLLDSLESLIVAKGHRLSLCRSTRSRVILRDEIRRLQKHCSELRSKPL